MKNELKPCPECGEVPKFLIVTNRDSQPSIVSVTCKHDCNHSIPITTTEAWNAAPRGERVCEYALVEHSGLLTYQTTCGIAFFTGENSIRTGVCGGCGCKIQVKEQSND